MRRIGRPPVSPLAVLRMLLFATLILFLAQAALAQVASDLIRFLHVDLDQRPRDLPGSRATGHVTNDSAYRLTNVRLRLDAVDAAGQPLPPTSGWVDGDVPAHGRAWFRILVPSNAARFSVSVIDFHVVSIESP